MDITVIIEVIFVLILGVGVLFANKYLGADKVQKVMTIAQAVVAAANELEITGELIKLGKTKAEYALERAKTLLAKNNITFDEDELLVFIKSAVTRLRVETSGTTAEKANTLINNTVNVEDFELVKEVVLNLPKHINKQV